MLDLVQAHVTSQRPALRAAFESAQPFPHLVIDKFFEDGFCRDLLAEFPVFDPVHATDEVGRVGRKAVVSNLRTLGGTYVQLDKLLTSKEFLDLTSAITGIPDLIADPDYLGGGTHENLEGEELDAHVDFNIHPSRRLHRRLNLILFLNHDWNYDWGGVLELCRDPWLEDEENDIKAVLPLYNRAVIFETSERSWHGFKRIQFPAGIEPKPHRRSLALYYYTQTREAAQVAPEHGTVYIPRHLPNHIRAGHVLTEQDVEHIRVLLHRRDARMKYLYERELHSSKITAERRAYVDILKTEKEALEAIRQNLNVPYRSASKTNEQSTESLRAANEYLRAELDRVTRSVPYRYGKPVTRAVSKLLQRVAAPFRRGQPGT
jgi:2OG-Fe(II) oxygenase superfamily